jgi:hypothetical protein
MKEWYTEESMRGHIAFPRYVFVLVDFINWAIIDSQQFAPDIGYVPLPEQVVQLNQETLRGLTHNGASLQVS